MKLSWNTMYLMCFHHHSEDFGRSEDGLVMAQPLAASLTSTDAGEEMFARVESGESGRGVGFLHSARPGMKFCGSVSVDRGLDLTQVSTDYWMQSYWER
jgi:hypothetical protein